MMLITHDIGLVAQMSDRILVMYAGQIVESAPTKVLFSSPAHPYTRALLASVPHADGAEEQLSGISGTVPEQYGSMSGCRFRTRCPYAVDACERKQAMQTVADGHTVRCCRCFGEGAMA